MRLAPDEAIIPFRRHFYAQLVFVVSLLALIAVIWIDAAVRG